MDNTPTVEAPAPDKVADKKGKKKPQGSQAKVTGMTAFLRSIASGMTMHLIPERSFYLLPIPDLLRIALVFDAFCRTQPRPNPGHPVGLRYASLFLYGMAAKLARVCVETYQGTIPQDRLPLSNFVRLPAVMTMLIDQFGEFVEQYTGVVVAPLVMPQTVSYLLHLASKLRNQYNDLIDPANHRAYRETAYTPRMQQMVGLSVFARAVPCPFNTSDASDAEYRKCAGRVLFAGILEADPNLVLVNLGGIRDAVDAAVNPAGITHDFFTIAGGIPNPPGMADFLDVPPVHQHLLRARARVTSAVDPWIDPNVGVPDLPPAVPNGWFGQPLEVVTAEGDMAWMSKQFELSLVACTRFGTCAPTGVYGGVGDGMAISSVIRGMLPQEAVVSGMLGFSGCELVSSRGAFLNTADVNSFLPLSSSSMQASPASLLARALGESLKASGK